MTDRETSLAAAARLVDDGDTVAFGGKTLHRAPMAFARQLVREERADLDLVGLAKGPDVDLLCGAGVAESVQFGYVGFEWLGLAPNFRAGVEAGSVTPREGTCYTVATALRGGRQGVESLPIEGLEGSDIPAHRPDTFERVRDPYTGEWTYAVRALRPDVGVLHAVEADRRGNARFVGADLTERLVAAAARTTVVTAERVVDRVEGAPEAVDVPEVLVDAVVEAPFGAHPSSCPGEYEYDRAHLRDYLDSAREGEFGDYLDETLGADEADYRARVDASAIDWDGAAAGGRRGTTSEHDPLPDARWTVAEQMTVALARRIRGVDTVFQGFASPLATVALRVAREQDETITPLSASGAVDAHPDVMPTSTEDQHLLEGAGGTFGSPEAFDLAARGELDVMFIGSPQIDRAGRMNGSVVGDYDRPKVRFGGGGGAGSLLPLLGEGFAWRTEHSPRTLPAEVDFVTAAGNLSYAVTPLCEFERIDGELQVVALHPGVTEADVRENTGWDVTVARNARTDPPSETELDLLDRVDPSRVRRSEFDPDQLRSLERT
ncbi:MAG: CoA-transferase [Haloarculaceae archaeon]